jgi:lipopolysaccharide/colanic/teichoic acid biosynthesis glycosyltransferase
MSIPACGENKAAFDLHSSQATPGFYASYGKRALDICGSAGGLLMLSPVFAIAALSIKLTSRGPVFFRQTRIGRQGHPFRIFKFRSMHASDSDSGSAITIAGDARVTQVGRFLRRFKLDELPQLWNVLRGDMSLVGPRPEVPVYVADYTLEQRVVLSVRPGVTDPSSLAYRREEEILAAASDPESFYKTRILPDKLARSGAYLQNVTFYNDVRIILKTFASSLFGQS